MKSILLIGLFAFCTLRTFGQCTVRGQTPATAFPVCGTTVFEQKEVPNCQNGAIPVPGCSGDGAQYGDQSPFWYKFTCFESGTLGLLIEPVDKSDDYDWQIFDVTGHDAEDVYTNPSLYVGANWAGVGGNTGASSAGKSNLQCASSRDAPESLLFSSMPHLIKGHKYLLLVSHFSGSTQSGYKLSFNGGTAVITDTTTPRLKHAIAECNGRMITISLNKGMKCNSLAADGSDFKIMNNAGDVTAAYALSCKTGFDMQQLTVELDQRLNPGTYTIVIQPGTDGNTLLDNCGNGILPGDTLQFIVETIHPTPMDSVTALKCVPQHINVVFEGNMLCSSIAKDGSDFAIIDVNTGVPLTITGAVGIACDSNRSNTVQIDLASPIYNKATYQLVLKQGSDGNSVLSECEVASPAQILTFESFDTVSAVIDSRIQYDCNKASVTLSNPGGNGIDEWVWASDSVFSGNTSTLAFLDTTFAPRQIKLSVSNGVCSDEQSMKLEFDQDYYLRANFEIPEFVCPQDPVIFKDLSLGEHITQWAWNFGNGQQAYRAQPRVQHYPVETFTENYRVELQVTNSRGCSDTTSRVIKVINTCEVFVPTAFTPNGDNMNDYLYPLNAYLAKDLIFKVYNRYGQLVFQTKDWTHGWDGTLHGQPQSAGSYVWVLRFVNSKTGKKVFRKGTTLLVK